MIDDYLQMRPERREQVERLVRNGRLIIGPWYTLAEEFSIAQEAIVRNLLWGRRADDGLRRETRHRCLHARIWGQTGQLPQILAGFGIRNA